MAQSHTNRRSPRNTGSFLMGLAAVLFCMVAFSTYLMGGLYARYTTLGQGSDSARVAKFDVSVDKPEDIEIEYGISKADSNGDGVLEDDAANYVLTFHNRSEVAVSYSIVVEVYKAEEETFNIQVALEDQALDTVNGTRLDFGVVGHIPVGGGPVNEPLTFSVVDWKDFTSLGTGASRELSLDFKVFITITQVD